MNIKNKLKYNYSANIINVKRNRYQYNNSGIHLG